MSDALIYIGLLLTLFITTPTLTILVVALLIKNKANQLKNNHKE